MGVVIETKLRVLVEKLNDIRNRVSVFCFLMVFFIGKDEILSCR